MRVWSSPWGTRVRVSTFVAGMGASNGWCIGHLDFDIARSAQWHSSAAAWGRLRSSSHPPYPPAYLRLFSKCSGLSRTVYFCTSGGIKWGLRKKGRDEAAKWGKTLGKMPVCPRQHLSYEALYKETRRLYGEFAGTMVIS